VTCILRWIKPDLERSCLVLEIKASLARGFLDISKKRGPGVEFLIAI